MTKHSHSDDANYGREISDLKEVLSKLSDNVGSLNVSIATNTQAMHGLSQVVEKDSARTNANMQVLENKNSVVEARVDEVDVKMALMSHTESSVINLQNNLTNLQNKVQTLEKESTRNNVMMTRCAEVAKAVGNHQERLDTLKGKISGLTVAGVIVSVLCLPVAGWFLMAVANNVFHTPPHP